MKSKEYYEGLEKRMFAIFLVLLVVPLLMDITDDSNAFFENKISATIDKTTHKMLLNFVILVLISMWIIGLSALYFVRPIKYYGRKLKYTKDFLDNIIENANDIIYVLDKNGNFKFLNKKAEEITGYKREEFIGRPFTEVLAPEYLNRKGESSPQSYETEIITKYGERVQLELNTTTVKKNGKIVGMQGIARDITEKKKLEKEIYETKNYLASIVTNSADAIISTDLEGKVVSWNKAAERIYGWTEQEVIGKRHPTVPPNLITEAKELIKKVKQNIQVSDYVTTDIRKDGSKIMVSLTISPILDSVGDLIGISVIARDITEKKKLEKEIYETKNYLANIVTNSADAIIATDLEGKVVSWNKAAESIYGWTEQEVIGKRVPTVPSQELEDILKKARKREIIIGYETERVHKDGSKIMVISTISPILDCTGKVIGVSGITRDITEKKKLEKEIYETKNYLASIVTNSADAIIATDLEGKVVSWNKAAESIYGWTEQEVIGKRVPTVPSQELEDILKKARKREDIINYETERVHKDGSKIMVTSTISPILDCTGKVIGVSGITRDITEKKKLELQLIQSAKMASIGQLAAGVAHNLRSPLSVIKGFPEIVLYNLKNGSLEEEELKEWMQIIIDDIKKCFGFIDNLLEFSKTKTNKEYISIVQVIDSALELIGNLLIKNKIEIIKDIKDYKVYANKNQLMQVFINLFTNAKDAMPEGGKLFINAKKINKELVELKVRDTGIGIKGEYINRIFEPFFSTKGTADGSGIGLSISRKIINEHKGFIEVDSEEGIGTTITIKLPIGEVI